MAVCEIPIITLDYAALPAAYSCSFHLFFSKSIAPEIINYVESVSQVNFRPCTKLKERSYLTYRFDTTLIINCLKSIIFRRFSNWNRNKNRNIL